jgi:peroxiredoxin
MQREVISILVVILLGLAAGPALPAQEKGPSRVKLPSRPKIGSPAPEFTLTDLEGKEHRLADLRADPKHERKGNIVVLVWWSATGPTVAKTDPILNVLHKRFAARDVKFLAINPFVSRKPKHYGTETLPMVREFKRIRRIAFPILLDYEKKVSKRFGARQVPEVVLIDRAGTIRYRGAVVTPLIKPGERRFTPYLENALTAVLAGKMVQPNQTKTFGNAIPY